MHVGLGKIKGSDISQYLNGANGFTIPASLKQKFIVTAPAKGLCLNQVFYDRDGKSSDPTKPAVGPSMGQGAGEEEGGPTKVY